MSRDTLPTSTVGFLSNAVCISCIIVSKWTIQESPVRKPDCEEVKSFLLWKWLNRELKITLSKILLNMGSKLIGRHFFKRFYLLFCVPERHLLFSKFSEIYLLVETAQILFWKEQLRLTTNFNHLAWYIFTAMSLSWIYIFLLWMMSSSVKSNFMLALVLYENNGNTLEFFICVHIDTKRLLKILAFSQKSETNLPLTNKAGIAGIFFI